MPLYYLQIFPIYFHNVDHYADIVCMSILCIYACVSFYCVCVLLTLSPCPPTYILTRI